MLTLANLRRLQRSPHGFTVVELIVTAAIALMASTLIIPMFVEWSAALRVGLAAREMAGALYQARFDAIRFSTHVAVRFETDPKTGVTSYAFYRDGDGDGVLTRDIEAGIDPMLRPPRPLERMKGSVGFGIPKGLRPPHPGNPRRPLDHLDDPIRYNRSNMATFSGEGTATPGTIYLTDGRRHLVAVRTDHRSGRISIRTYDPRQGAWH